MLGDLLKQPEKVEQPPRVLGAAAIAPLQTAVARLHSEIVSLQTVLDKHLQLATVRYSYERDDSCECGELFLKQLAKISKLEGKKFEEQARCAQRLLRALERTKHLEEIMDIIHQIERGTHGVT